MQVARVESTILEVKGACSNNCATEAPTLLETHFT